MNFRIVVRKTTKGKPTWYFYGPTGYIGALFLPDADMAAELSEIIDEGNWQGAVTYVDGPDFGQSAAAS